MSVRDNTRPFATVRHDELVKPLPTERTSMTITPDRRVEEHYRALERHWLVQDGANDYGRLVTPTGNSDQPIHRWFHLKEGFSHALLLRVVKDLEMANNESPRILDCFAGGGTTLVSAAELAASGATSVHVRGVERNPFLHLVASVKASASSSALPGLESRIIDTLPEVERRYKKKLSNTHQIPELATWRNAQYFNGDRRHELLSLRSAVGTFTNSDVSEILLFAAAATVESCTQLRKDGRALRYQPTKIPREPWREFTRRLGEIVLDLSKRSRVNVDSLVVLGDGRRPDLCLPANADPYDLIVFSPPYPNNIDYTEVYKLEGWFLGAYGNHREFREQRLSTVRSHSSIASSGGYRFLDSESHSEVQDLLSPILCGVPQDRYLRARRAMINGYADDMLSTLTACRQLINSNGALVFVVGNSVHGTKQPFIVAADLLIARLGELCGWHVREIRPARYPRRRRIESNFVRESIVVLEPESDWTGQR